MAFDADLLAQHLAASAEALPGPDYYQVLGWIHEWLNPRTYVEIGVRSGASLASALPHTRCVAIDPAPTISFAVPLDTAVFPITSDEFFCAHAPRDVLGQEAFDFAFIDGLHLFDQALHDFINLERWSGPRSLIAIHDCIPLDDVTSQRSRSTHFYSGDVWKVAACLRKYRPDLRMAVVRTAPTGLCLVGGLDRASEALLREHDRIVREYRDLGFHDYATNDDVRPVAFPNTRGAVEQCLRDILRDL